MKLNYIKNRKSSINIIELIISILLVTGSLYILSRTLYERSISSSKLENSEVISVVTKAIDAEARIISEASGNESDTVKGYFKLTEEFDTTDKIKSYLLQYWGNSEFENFMKNYSLKIVDGHTYVPIGDIGEIDDFSDGIIKTRTNYKSKIICTIESPSFQENASVELFFEGGKWVLASIEFNY